MMLALLIYCYANGLFSSRRIERATYRDVAVRYLTADTPPDHDTICAFRRNNLDAIAVAFVDVLELARERKLLQLGTVSLEGTHIRASASKDQNVTYERAQQLRAQLRQDVNELLQQAERADQQDDDPQQLPQEIARREKLLAKMDAACARLEQRAQARAAAERADYERKVATREQREGSAKGPEPKPPKETPAPDAQINLTDPDARLMRKSKRESYTQSYNAQAVVDAGESRLIGGQRVSGCASDAGQLEPDLQSIPATLGLPEKALADCGYVDTEVFQRLGEQRPALDLYVSVHREDAHAERRYDYRPLDKIKPPKALKDPVLLAMAEKLKTPEGQAIYRQRACTVEPVFGIIKAVLGFRQFLLRGMRKVSGEWNLVCLTYNLKRLHRLGAALKLTLAA
jgi:chromatin segregation and condensation protein Rec8/ScpA/Scc1 (kleisin family)